MSEFNVPPEWASLKLGEVPAEEDAPLDTSPEGREVLRLLEDIEQALGTEFSMYQAMLSAKAYHARLFSFEAQKIGKKVRWKLSRLCLAAPQYLGGDVVDLSTLMDTATGTVFSGSSAMWVHAIPGSEHRGFLGFVRHQNGMEVLVGITQGRITPLPWNAKRRQLLMKLLALGSKHDTERWSKLLTRHLSETTDGLREALSTFLQEASGELTDAQWEEFLAMVYVNERYYSSLQRLVQLAATPALHEGQRLVTATVKRVDTALTGYKEQIEATEKRHARALKQFKKDHDKLQAAATIASNRAQRLERELHDLRQQMSRSPAAQSDHLSTARALDRFFMPPG